ncbi:hypothetical protein SAMN06266787_11515 [Halorubrum ezzemoulense]|uniref:Uncharacterized protein n=1 Tax=Halorubrum ezzemoulense TaxID=337243 RepID=A0A238YLX3_HALEZ|nr:hypothetical protein SAMN06266787_11515 [Halorubrum ezzemoulense]
MECGGVVGFIPALKGEAFSLILPKSCETNFNDLTKTIFGQHRFGLEEMFYIVKEM